MYNVHKKNTKDNNIYKPIYYVYDIIQVKMGGVLPPNTIYIFKHLNQNYDCLHV